MSSQSPPPVVASSLSSVLELAAKPPARFPKRFRQPGHQPLVLHLLRVPDSKDLILTPLAPVSHSRVTSEDILSSVYYFQHIPQPTDNSTTHKKDSFAFKTIRRSPIDSSQTDVAEVSSQPLPPATAPPMEESWDGLIELEKPPVDIVIGTEGYKPFAEGREVFKTAVVYVRKKWYRSKKKQNKDVLSRLPPGYSFAVPWFMESVGLYDDGRWAKCHGDGTGRAVFEEDPVGRKLDCILYPPSEAGEETKYRLSHIKLAYSSHNKMPSKHNEPSAELAIITIYEPGFLMLDLTVTSSVAIAWRKWCGWVEKHDSRSIS